MKQSPLKSRTFIAEECLCSSCVWHSAAPAMYRGNRSSATPPRSPPVSRSSSAHRGHSYEHVDTIYRDERDRQGRLAEQMSGWRADAASLRAAGDRAGAEKVEQMLVSMQQLQRFLQQRAPERVFERVNSAYKNEIVVDCHALHANEAIEKVRTTIKGFNSCSGVSFSLRIVTGKGSHSKGGQPVLLPAVRSYLLEQAYPFEEHDGYISINFGN